MIKRDKIDKQGRCDIEITVHNFNDKKNIYIDYITIDGEKMDDYPFLDHIKHLTCRSD